MSEIRTIKKSHGLYDELVKDDYFVQFMREANVVKRISNKLYEKNEDISQSEVEKHIKSKVNNISLVNASWIKSISNSMKNNERESPYFGSNYIYKKLSKKEYKSEEEHIELKKAIDGK